MPAERSNGPDWADVSMMLDALETFHDGQASLEIRQAPGVHTCALHVKARFVSTMLDEGAVARTLEVEGEWPTAANRTLEGFVFRILHELDAKCGKQLWRQGSLWGA